MTACISLITKNARGHRPRLQAEHPSPSRCWVMIKSLMQSPGVRYGCALLFVGAALFLSLLVQPLVPDAFLICFLCAVMLASWFGRTAAGVFAVIVSTLAVDYYFITPYRAFFIKLDELPYFLTFLLSAVVTSWLASARRSAE